MGKGFDANAFVLLGWWSDRRFYGKPFDDDIFFMWGMVTPCSQEKSDRQQKSLTPILLIKTRPFKCATRGSNPGHPD